MSKKIKDYHPTATNLVEVKSKFDAEFRRFAINRSAGGIFETFYKKVEALHQLQGIPFVILYTDKDGDLLPINNNDNFIKAVSSNPTVLRIIIQRKDENWSDLIGYSTLNRKKEGGKNKILGLTQLPLPTNSGSKTKTPHLKIGMPEDFRQVSAIIDVDILPQTHRRVRLLKHGSDKPLGFFIRDGISIQSTPFGLERVPGVFISRVVPGGLAESTGLLSVNDEVIEVNGIEVAGKSLDQVTDMMVANCSNLIITVKPANQRFSTSPSGSDAQIKSSATRNNPQRSSQMSASAASTSSYPSNHSYNTDDDDLDEIRDLTGNDLLRNGNGNASGSSGSGTSSSSTAPPRDSGHYGKRPIINGQHVTKIILDGKHDGIIHEAEQVFTL